jgi:hypothetical protein
VSALTLSSVRHLFGEWSAIALIAGAIGAFLSHLVTRRGYSSLNAGGEWLVVYGLPWTMGLLSMFLAWFIPASAAFSGPLERWAWHEVARYDVRLAFYIALTFGFAFALDSLRVKTEKAKTGVCANLLAYLLIGAIVFCANLFKSSS